MTSTNSERVTIQGMIKRETNIALLVEIELPCKDILSKWIPVSQVIEITRNADKPDELVITQWIYDKLELY